MPAELPLAELQAFMADNLAGPAANLPMRALLHTFADDRGIPLRNRGRSRMNAGEPLREFVLPMTQRNHWGRLTSMPCLDADGGRNL